MINFNAFKKLSLLLTFLLCTTASMADEKSDTDQAKNTVEKYMSALSDGDTKTIIELLGGNFLKRRAQVLNSDQYSDLLQERYQTLQYNLKVESMPDDDTWMFKTHLYFGNQDQVRRQCLKTEMKSDLEP